jgi:hypothetical protein
LGCFDETEHILGDEGLEGFPFPFSFSFSSPFPCPFAWLVSSSASRMFFLGHPRVFSVSMHSGAAYTVVFVPIHVGISREGNSELNDTFCQYVAGDVRCR